MKYQNKVYHLTLHFQFNKEVSLANDYTNTLYNPLIIIFQLINQNQTKLMFYKMH